MPTKVKLAITLPLPGAGRSSGWTVVTEVKNGKVSQHAEEYDFVVLATGSFLTPRIPFIQVHSCLSVEAA